MQLASWHTRAPQALVVYRQQVDGIATRAYEEAIAQSSEAKLQRVVDELLLSSVGDQALLRLGEMALERGNYTLARRSWESIHPQLRVFPAAARVLQCAAGCSWWSALRGRDWEPQWAELAATFAQPAGPVHWLAYPDSDIPLASVRARLVLVSLLEGSLEHARDWKRNCCDDSIRTPPERWASGAASWSMCWPSSCSTRRRGRVRRDPPVGRPSPAVRSRNGVAEQGCRHRAAPDLAHVAAATGGSTGSSESGPAARGGVGRRIARLPRGRRRRRGVHLSAGRDPCLASGGRSAALAGAGTAALSRGRHVRRDLSRGVHALAGRDPASVGPCRRAALDV